MNKLVDVAEVDNLERVLIKFAAGEYFVDPTKSLYSYIRYQDILELLDRSPTVSEASPPVEVEPVGYELISEELEVDVLPDENGLYEHRFKFNDRLSQQQDIYILSATATPDTEANLLSYIKSVEEYNNKLKRDYAVIAAKLKIAVEALNKAKYFIDNCIGYVSREIIGKHRFEALAEVNQALKDIGEIK